MVSIDFEEDKYTVLDELKLSEYHGTYRSIQYDTGYYALQYMTVDSSIKVWKTIFICPVLDFKPNIEGSIRMPYGKFYIDTLLRYLEESDKLYNGEYWTLDLTLSDDSNFLEVITKGDGETLLEQLRDLMSLEEEQMLIYNQVSPWISRLRILFYIVCIIVLVCVILLVGYELNIFW